MCYTVWVSALDMASTMGSCKREWIDPNAMTHSTYANIAVVFALPIR